MIKRTFEITARIEQGQLPLCFQAVQNDKDVYVLRIRITEGDKEIDYTQVSSATITFALANGAVVQSDSERLTVSATGIIYQMGASEIACPGKVTASIQLFGSNGERLTTARFQFEVVADLITPSAVQSTSEFPILQKLVQDVQAAVITYFENIVQVDMSISALDVNTNKRYRYGLRLSAEGNPQIMFEEVI